MIKLSTPNVSLDPTIGITSIMIVVPCATQSGIYYTTFTISDTTNYYAFPPITVFVDVVVISSTVSASKILLPPLVQGGSQSITFTLSGYPIDNLVYTL